MIDVGKKAHCSCGHRFIVPGFSNKDPDTGEPKTIKSAVVIVSPSVFEQDEFPEEVSEEYASPGRLIGKKDQADANITKQNLGPVD
jgi:hypothetical protein